MRFYAHAGQPESYYTTYFSSKRKVRSSLVRPSVRAIGGRENLRQLLLWRRRLRRRNRALLQRAEAVATKAAAAAVATARHTHTRPHRCCARCLPKKIGHRRRRCQPLESLRLSLPTQTKHFRLEPRAGHILQLVGIKIYCLCWQKLQCYEGDWTFKERRRTIPRAEHHKGQ